MVEQCLMHLPSDTDPLSTGGTGANIKGGLKINAIPPPQVTQLVSLHNSMKYQISGPILHIHRTVFEITVLLYPNHYNTDEFRGYLSKVQFVCLRCSKKYDPTTWPNYRGYSTPYLSRRSIRGKNNCKRRRGQYEYKLTHKGRRMLCEWTYRLQLGHTDLKWTGEYYNPLLNICDKNCAACPECVW